MFEIEQKFAVPDRESFLSALADLNPDREEIHNHSDTYYRHPCRDFEQTQEALRIRRTDGVASITYKGQKLPQADATMKARKELEWALGENDVDGSQMDQLLLSLGFAHVTTVSKHRRSYSWTEGKNSDFCVTLDSVENVGLYAEIELLVSDESEIANASERISNLADLLGLDQPERSSYLEMLLARQGAS